MEMVARIRAVLRARKRPAKATFTQPAVSLSTARATPSRSNKRAVELTLKEFALLCELMKNKGIVLTTRDVLLGRIWGYKFHGETRTVDVHIRTNLRSKLGKRRDIIETRPRRRL